MRISDLLTEVVQPKPLQTGQNPPTVHFGELFQSQAPIRGRSDTNSDLNRGSNREQPANERPTNTERQDRRVMDRSTRVETERSVSNRESAIDTQLPENSANTDNDLIPNEEVMIMIAVIMQIPVEELEVLLEELGIEVMDLIEPKNVVKVLQAFMDYTDEAELITSEEFSSAFKSIKEVMTGIKEGNTELLMEVLETVELPTLTTGENTNRSSAYQLPVSEDIEVITEENEVVLVQNPTEDVAEEQPHENVRTVSETTEQTQTTDTTQGETAAGPVQVDTNEPVATVQQENVNSEFAVQQQVIEQTQQTAVTRSTPIQNTQQSVVEQVINQVKVINSGGQFTEMRLTLRPETLGDIILRVVTQNGIVVAQFEAENQRVKELLEANFNTLRDSLQDAGIRFSELSVSVRQGEEERMNQYQEGRNRNRRRIESVQEVEAEEEISLHDGDIDITA